MKALILSDIHIQKSTPWSDDYEDFSWIVDKIRQEFHNYESCIIAGDIFSTPKITQTDLVMFRDLLEAFQVWDKPVFAITGNHDLCENSVCSLLPCGRSLHTDFTNFAYCLQISGMNYTPDLDNVRSFLKSSLADVLVLHQSARPFFDLSSLDVPQLVLEDFPDDKLTIVGDTHVSRVVPKGSGAVISPGIIAPMRSKAELLAAQTGEPYAPGYFTLDLATRIENMTLEFNPLPCRKACVYGVPSNKSKDPLAFFTEFDRMLKDWKPGDLPIIVYLQQSDNDCLPELKKDHRLRVIQIPDATKDSPIFNSTSTEVDTVDDVTNDTILAAASEMIDEKDQSKPQVLSLLQTALSGEQMEENIKRFLVGN